MRYCHGKYQGCSPPRSSVVWKPASPLSATILPSVRDPLGDHSFSTIPTLACGIYRMPSNHLIAAAQSPNTTTPTTTFTIRFVICQLLSMANAVAATDCPPEDDRFKVELQARQSFQLARCALEKPPELRTPSGPHDQHGA